MCQADWPCCPSSGFRGSMPSATNASKASRERDFKASPSGHALNRGCVCGCNGAAGRERSTGTTHIYVVVPWLCHRTDRFEEGRTLPRTGALRAYPSSSALRRRLSDLTSSLTQCGEFAEIATPSGDSPCKGTENCCALSAACVSATYRGRRMTLGASLSCYAESGSMMPKHLTPVKDVDSSPDAQEALDH